MNFYNNKNIYSFTSWEPNIAVTYNLTNGFLGYKPYRRNNVYVHLGPSLAIRNAIDADEAWLIENRDRKCVIGGKLGLNYVYSFNNWIAFTADITGTIYGDKFSGNAWQTAVDGRINLGVGLRVYLTKSTKPAREVVYRDEVLVKHDTIRVHEQKVVNDIDLYPVNFAADKSTIESDQDAVVKTVAEKLKANPSRVVYVIGNHDKSSDTKDAATLTKDRADAVVDALINKYGIDPDRIIEHDKSTATPYTTTAANNRATICIVTDLKHN